MDGRSEIANSIITGARSLSITAVDNTVAETTATLRDNPIWLLVAVDVRGIGAVKEEYVGLNSRRYVRSGPVDGW